MQRTLNSLKAAISRRPPFCTGTIPISSDYATLFFKQGKSSSWLDLSQANHEGLKALSEACEPATFGLGERDVLDEEYRKAGKMDTSNFATKFDLTQLGILDRIRAQLLEGENEEKYVKAELYKLNVYGKDGASSIHIYSMISTAGKGSFFKSHKDTPRGDTMFGSLVVVFPTTHEGGALKLRHDDEEWTFDSAVLTREESTPSIAYIAFYSDVDHEVALVTAGYRVTLTYNLFLDSNPGVPLPKSVQPVSADDRFFLEALKVALDDPSFLPKGGYLGFGLNFKYPVSKVQRGRSTVSHILKGSDAMILRVLQRLSLTPSLNAIYRACDNNVLVPASKLFGDGDSIYEDDITQYLCENHDGKVLREFGQPIRRQRDYFGRYERNPVRIAWVTPLTTYSSFSSTYAAHGNEPTTECIYASLCIAVNLGPFGDRAAGVVYDDFDSDD
ncbi:hypothetical protein H0H81_008589 [Sphagnurus paluster]|uniref:Prolyl 4-hydroxylase alpha subunit Fe(2+) 2OG dioxygenase domain-containing protein n=1 Tax=Sphagnurus paluster TaxID=117069 RepID=A0A9P7GMX4_9AGAR|nr:hypothetical protein H0H81_008589 [Sphagnurus paluster]